jgi:hypothetical protein
VRSLMTAAPLRPVASFGGVRKRSPSLNSYSLENSVSYRENYEKLYHGVE